MSQKRNPNDALTFGKFESNYSPNDKRRRSTPSFTSVVVEAMGQKSLQHVLEPMLRRVVKEEVESAIQKHVFSKRDSEEVSLPSEPRSLRLKFLSRLALPVFTGTRIEGEDGCAIKIALADAFTDEVVLYGSESSAKVEIVVLEGDFDSEERGTWTLDEFRNNIVREREGKKPLLAGDNVPVFLNEGVGSIGEISFTDNSSWTRSRRFRLGARIVGSSDGARVREAKSESFIVRDHRGELYKKHHPPSLFDEVWRLEKIGKEGAFHRRLAFDRVKTVKDFLIVLNLDPARLRNILGAGMSAKMWDVTVEHARTCVLDKKIYLYYSLCSEHKNGVVFNVVGQIMGLYSENQYTLIDNLSETEKADALRMVIEAFQHWDGVISFEDLNSLIGDSSNNPTVSEKVSGHDCAKSGLPSPDILSPIYSFGCMESSNDFSLQNMDTMDMRYDTVTPGFLDDEHLGFMDIEYTSIPRADADFDSHADLESAFSVFLKSQSSPHTAKGSAHRKWRVLSSIIRWFSLRKLVEGRKTLLRGMPRHQ